jgi:predicted GIY-YIG superfamily endonuclease
VITYIYILQDPDTMDVRYVGKTTNPRKRLYQHTNKRVQEYSRRRYLSNWLLKLLNDNKKPIMTIIDQIENDWRTLEIYWIEQFKNWGYKLVNITIGGDGIEGYTHTKETIEKLSEMITCISPDGVEHSGNCKEIANKIGVTSSAIYNALYKSITGKVKGWHSFKMLTPNDKYLSNLDVINQGKPKISELCKQVSASNCKRLFSKPIVQYDKLMNIVSEYESLSEASRQTNINAQNISAVCLNRNKSAGGYVWRYKKLIEIAKNK